MSFPSNTANVPIEVLENVAPMRFHRRSLRPGSGGAGKYRGGLGQELELELLPGVEGQLVIRHEHVALAPEGLQGGLPGARGRNLINGKEVVEKGTHVIRGGDVVRFELPGGGGFGPPEERAPESIDADLIGGYVEGQ
jgi:N-methylhydantoinase B